MFGRYRTVSQLASINDAKENEFIRKLSNDSMWIGLDARGVYRGKLTLLNYCLIYFIF